MSSRKTIKVNNIIENEMVEAFAEVPVEKLKDWDDNSKLKVIGKKIPRIDGYEKVSGGAEYTFDKTLPNMAFARTLRSPHAHANIKKIDTSKAEKLPGVLAIIHSQNTSEIPWYWSTSRLFDTHLRFVGDEVACVAAESEVIANQALQMIEVEYEILPHVIDAGKAMKEEAPKLFDWGNILRGKPDVHERGDITKGFTEADVIIEETFTTQVAVHNPTEAHCSVVNWDGDYLTVWDSTQAIFSVREQVADSLNIPASHVRVIKKYMGGGFGSKLATGKYTVMAALLARQIGRPVKIILDRKEMNLAVGNRPDSVQKLKIGVKKDGTITAMRHYSFGASGAYPSGAGCSWPFRTVYKCPNLRSEEYSVFINAGAGRPMRAPGHVQGTFGMDSLIDMAAEKIGFDPLEFRLKNYAEIDQESNQPYTSKLLRQCYEQGARAIGWQRRNKIAGSGKGSLKCGIGMATQIWWGGGGPPAYANLKLNSDGSAEVVAGTQDLGGGTYTFIAQIVAEVLEIPIAKINVVLGDTAAAPYCPVSGGSMTAPSVSPAVRDAAEQMKAKLLQSAATLLETNHSDLIYSNAVISSISKPDKKITVPEIMDKTYMDMLVTSGAREQNPPNYQINTFGAQFAEVEVDVETGKVRVIKIVGAYDIGRVLNWKTMENQVHGGIMQGLSFALMEERVMDATTGKVLTVNIHDYKMPILADTPEIEVIVVSPGDALISNTGVKGVGEPAHIPTAAAIANAVYNAIGVRIKSLPITPDKILMALHN